MFSHHFVVVKELETSTLKKEDHFYSYVQENYAFMEATHEGCYTKCTSKPDVTYLTMQEGLCFRNCLSKFNSWYP